jgi:hypothetical protein
MKKIFTFVVASLLTTATVFAADRKPEVRLSAAKNYEIVIDGRSYLSNNRSTMDITSLRNGQHRIQVFETSRGFYKKSKHLVSSSAFQLRGNDIAISVDFRGQIRISEDRFGRGNDRKYDDNGWGQSDDHRNDQRNDRDNDRRGW